MRVLGAVMGWILVAVQPTKDYTARKYLNSFILERVKRKKERDGQVIGNLPLLFILRLRSLLASNFMNLMMHRTS